MVENNTVRTTFAMDSKITPEIIKTIADISRNSLTSYGERENLSDKYYRLLQDALENK